MSSNSNEQAPAEEQQPRLSVEEENERLKFQLEDAKQGQSMAAEEKARVEQELRTLKSKVSSLQKAVDHEVNLLV